MKFKDLFDRVSQQLGTTRAIYLFHHRIEGHYDVCNLDDWGLVFITSQWSSHLRNTALAAILALCDETFRKYAEILIRCSPSQVNQAVYEIAKQATAACRPGSLIDIQILHSIIYGRTDDASYQFGTSLAVIFTAGIAQADVSYSDCLHAITQAPNVPLRDAIVRKLAEDVRYCDIPFSEKLDALADCSDKAFAIEMFAGSLADDPDACSQFTLTEWEQLWAKASTWAGLTLAAKMLKESNDLNSICRALNARSYSDWIRKAFYDLIAYAISLATSLSDLNQIVSSAGTMGNDNGEQLLARAKGLGPTIDEALDIFPYACKEFREGYLRPLICTFLDPEEAPADTSG